MPSLVLPFLSACTVLFHTGEQCSTDKHYYHIIGEARWHHKRWIDGSRSGNKKWYQMRLYTTVFTLLTRQIPADNVQRWCPLATHTYSSQCVDLGDRWLLLTIVRYITIMVHNKIKKKTKKIALCSMIIAVLCEDKVKRREWCKEWFHKRSERGNHATILHELLNGYESDFTNYMRMDPNTFYDLLEKVKPFIIKQDTIMRDSISPEARLEATLIYLSTGYSYSSLQYRTRIWKQSLSSIISDTCQTIYDVLKDPYLKVSNVCLWQLKDR